MNRRHSILCALSFCINEVDELTDRLLDANVDKSLSDKCVEACNLLESIYDILSVDRYKPL